MGNLSGQWLTSSDPVVYVWEQRVYLDRLSLSATPLEDPVIMETRSTAGIPIVSGSGTKGILSGLTLMVSNPASGEVRTINHFDLSSLLHAIEPPSGGHKIAELPYRWTTGSGQAEDNPLIMERSDYCGQSSSFVHRTTRHR